MASSPTLKFGPEWLRNLSDGSVAAAPSTSSASSSIQGSSSQGTAPVPKYKLAEFRYGREEMLALFCPPVPIPVELKDVKAILSDRHLQPLALQLETDDEQHLFSQAVNSTAVLRLTTRGSSAPLCLREVDRGRGRGRGRAEGRGFYSRVPSEEDSFSRTRHTRDGHDTEGRGRGFGYTGRSFDDMSTSSSSHGEFSRSMSTDNWRESRKYEDSKGNWRDLNQRPTNRRWKEPWEKSFEGTRDRGTDRRMSEDLCHNRSISAYRRSTSTNCAYEEESDSLPEWSMDDAEDVGTFDSSGAFMSLKDLEQQEKMDKESTSEDPWQDKEDRTEKEHLEIELENRVEFLDGGLDTGNSEPKHGDFSMQWQEQPVESASSDGDQVTDGKAAGEAEVINTEALVMKDLPPVLSSTSSTAGAPGEKLTGEEAVLPAVVDPGDAANSCKYETEQQETEVNFDHLERQVESLFYASFLTDDENIANVEREKGFLPPDHEDAKKWFYRDPQGQVQGPFTAGEMAEWFSAGYFSPNLVVKQGSDDCFVPLGELIKKMGSVPFISTPMKISPTVGSAATEVQQLQQDPLKLLLMQQQQQSALPQQLQQQLRNLPEPFAKMNPAQQRLLLQLILKQHVNPQVAAPAGQQQRPAKTSAINRPSPLDAVSLSAFHRLATTSSLPANNAASSFHRSLSQPSGGVDVSALPSNLLCGLAATTVSAGTAANLPTSAIPSSVSALWRSTSCSPSASNPSWMPESGIGHGLRSLDQQKTIMAAELEEIQYLTLEKAQQHQQQQSAQSLRDPHQLTLQELVTRAAAEKHRDINGTGALTGLDHQLRELLQQQKQQMDIVRLAEEQRRRLDERRRILEMNPPRLLRQDRSDDLYRQQLEKLCRLQNDSLASNMQERDALDVRQLLSLQMAQPWVAAHNRAQLAASGTGPAVTPSAGLFQNKESGLSSSGVSSIVQQELLSKHLKLNEMKTALNQWPIGSGGSSRWAGESGTWGTSLPSKSPVQWETATAATNSKTISSMIPFMSGGGSGGSGGLSSQFKQEFIQKLAKSKEELIHWCENVLRSMLTCSSMDIPTFIRHLMELSSAAEVNKFVQMYLGDTDDAKKFVKQFVEKHSRMQQETILMQYLSSGSQW